MVRPLIELIAWMPFRMLYAFSDVLCFALRLSGYRKQVIWDNLRNSFPQKTEKEITDIGREYYRYLCDLILEILKTLRMNAEASKKHCVFHNAAWLKKLCDEKKSIIVVMGHYGNWEWAGPSFTLNTGFQLVVIYRPLSNPHFEKMMTCMRTRFGTRITPVNNTLRDMVACRKELTATAFVADQTASRDNAYWTRFLNQDTAVFTGPEKLAKKFGYPVVYMSVRRKHRGLYEVFPELLFENPETTSEGEISGVFMKRLEQEIIANPVPWLWSHRRWKHKCPEKMQLIMK